MGTVPDVPLIHYDIDEDLHRRCKVAALMTGRTLKTLVEDALRAEAERYEADRGKDSR